MLLSTTRENIVKKVKLLVVFCEKYGMVINESKTKLMVINGSDRDKESISVSRIIINHCNIYIHT